MSIHIDLTSPIIRIYSSIHSWPNVIQLFLLFCLIEEYVFMVSPILWNEMVDHILMDKHPLVTTLSEIFWLQIGRESLEYSLGKTLTLNFRTSTPPPPTTSHGELWLWIWEPQSTPCPWKWRLLMDMLEFRFGMDDLLVWDGLEPQTWGTSLEILWTKYMSTFYASSNIHCKLTIVNSVYLP